jgi:hypothetical protein
VRKPRPALPPELDQLELTIRRLLEAHDGWQRRALVAESRIRELEVAVDDLSGGRIDPVALSEEVNRLEERNRSLVERLTQAHAAVQRMLARLQFTEENR